jgi:hypothetical protein
MSLTAAIARAALAASAGSVDVQAELDAMRADLAGIRAAQGERWLTERRAGEIRALVADALADSSARTSWNASGDRIGWDDGFVLRSWDDSFLVRINMLGQGRFVLNNNTQPTGSQPPAAVPDSGTNRNDQNTWGFEVRRAQLFFSGHVTDPSVEYMFGMAQDSQTDPYFLQQRGVGLIYAYVRKRFGDSLSVTVGRQNAPFTSESTLFNAGFTQMGEYSIFEYRAGLGQQTGACLEWRDDAVRWQGGWFDDVVPIPGNLAQWNSLFNAGVAVSSRLEWKPAGTWAQFAKESSFRGEDLGIALGGGVSWATGRSINSLIGIDASQFAATADARASFGGANAIAQLYWNDDGQDGTDQWGMNLQGGAFLADDVEAFAALSWFRVADPQWFVQAGGNLYLHGNALKLTAMAIVPLGGSFADASTYSLAGTGVSDVANNFSFVAQLQVMF